MGRQENRFVCFYHNVISEMYLHLLKTLCILRFENIPLVFMNRISFSKAVHCLNP